MSIKNLVVLSIVLVILGETLSTVLVDKSEFIFGLPGLNTHARAARKLVHNANWTSFATISTVSQISGFPVINVVSVADSPVNGESTGNIYFYLSTSSLEATNINMQNNVTALFTQNGQLNCQNNQNNAIETSCTQVMISGQVAQLYQGSNEYTLGQTAVLSRHPVSISWLNNNNFSLCQLIIENVYVIDSDGNAHNVSVKDYYNDKIFGIFDVHN